MATKQRILSKEIILVTLSTDLARPLHWIHAEEGYAALASMSHERSWKKFRLRPKLHMFAHVM